MHDGGRRRGHLRRGGRSLRRRRRWRRFRCGRAGGGLRPAHELRCGRGEVGRRRASATAAPVARCAHREPRLDAFDPLQQSGFRVAGRWQQQSGAHHFEQQTRRGGTAHLTQPGVHHLGVAGQRCGSQPGGLAAHPLEHVGGRVHHAARRRIRDGLHDDEVAEPFEQVRREAARIVARVDERLDGAEQGSGVADGQRVDGLVDQCDVGGTEEAECPAVLDASAVGTGQQLVEHREGVTWRTAAGADHQRVDGLLDDDVLLRTDALDQAAHGLRSEQPKRVVVGTRPDGGQHLLRLGGGEDEDQVLRRLLDDLEQRVEALLGHHVRLVDDEDAVPRLRGGVERAVAQLAGVVDTAVAGGVELGDVDAPRPVGGQRHARRADAARRRRGTLLAVERPGHDPSRGRLPAPPWSGEQVGVVDPARRERRRERFGDVLLANHFGERRGSVLAVESHGSRLPRWADG